jgi:hypothetical protein
MAIKVKDPTASAKKFVANASAAAPAYAAGVQAAGQTWQTNSAAAESNFVQGVTTAANAGRYSAGVNKAGASKYSTNAAGKGAQRYPAGVAAAGPTWQQNVQPYLTTIANLTLPPKGPTGSPQNIQRVQTIATALRAQKLGS